MATAREVVKSALRKILSLGDTEEPSASQMTDGLEELNDLMESLVVDGATVSHQTLTLDDNLNVDPAHIRGLKAQLAVDLAPEYGATVDPQTAFTAREAMKMLRADTKLRRTTTLDLALTRPLRW